MFDEMSKSPVFGDNCIKRVPQSLGKVAICDASQMMYRLGQCATGADIVRKILSMVGATGAQFVILALDDRKLMPRVRNYTNHIRSSKSSREKDPLPVSAEEIIINDGPLTVSMDVMQQHSSCHRVILDYFMSRVNVSCSADFATPCHLFVYAPDNGVLSIARSLFLHRAVLHAEASKLLGDQAHDMEKLGKTIDSLEADYKATMKDIISWGIDSTKAVTQGEADLSMVRHAQWINALHEMLVKNAAARNVYRMIFELKGDVNREKDNKVLEMIAAAYPDITLHSSDTDMHAICLLNDVDCKIITGVYPGPKKRTSEGDEIVDLREVDIREVRMCLKCPMSYVYALFLLQNDYSPGIRSLTKPSILREAFTATDLVIYSKDKNAVTVVADNVFAFLRRVMVRPRAKARAYPDFDSVPVEDIEIPMLCAHWWVSYALQLNADPDPKVFHYDEEHMPSWHFTYHRLTDAMGVTMGTKYLSPVLTSPDYKGNVVTYHGYGDCLKSDNPVEHDATMIEDACNRAAEAMDELQYIFYKETFKKETCSSKDPFVSISTKRNGSRATLVAAEDGKLRWNMVVAMVPKEHETLLMGIGAFIEALRKSWLQTNLSRKMIEAKPE